LSVGAGGVLLVTGLVLFVTAPSGNASAAKLPVLPSFSVDQRSALLGAVGQF
jgi:hypothetical protein